MKKGILWVGRKGNSKDSFGFAGERFFNKWMPSQHLFLIRDTLIDQTLFNIKKDKLFFLDQEVDVEKYTHAVFAFNAELVTKENYKRIEEVYYWLKQNTKIKIINKIEDFAKDAQKELYFEHLKNNGLLVPDWKVIESEEDLSCIAFPYIIKLNNLHQWKKVYNLNEAKEAYKILKATCDEGVVQEGLPLYYKFKDVDIKSLKFETKIIAVKYIKNFNGRYSSASSVSYVNGKMIYKYSLCSTEEEPDAIHISDIKDFKHFYEAQSELKKIVSINKQAFEKVKSLSLDTAKIDFLISEEKPIFLEQGVKIGTSPNIFELEAYYPRMSVNRKYEKILEIILGDHK